MRTAAAFCSQKQQHFVCKFWLCELDGLASGMVFCHAGLRDEEADYAQRMRKAERQQTNARVRPLYCNKMLHLYILVYSFCTMQVQTLGSTLPSKVVLISAIHAAPFNQQQQSCYNCRTRFQKKAWMSTLSPVLQSQAAVQAQTWAQFQPNVMSQPSKYQHQRQISAHLATHWQSNAVCDLCIKAGSFSMTLPADLSHPPAEQQL